MTEQEEFLKDLEGDNQDAFADRNVEIPGKEETEDEVEERRQNRKNRRKEERERQKDILIAQLNERVKVLSELDKFKADTTDDEFKELERVYGTDKPEHVAAGNILKNTFKTVQEKAIEKALERIQAERGNDEKAQQEEDRTVDEIEERIEDDYGIDMSNPTDRSNYFALMERMSPKDKEGNVKEYADPDAVAETFLRLKERASSRRQELSARSMTRSGASQPSKLEDDATQRFLRENDLL